MSESSLSKRSTAAVGWAAGVAVCWVLMIISNSLNNTGIFGPSNGEISDGHPVIITPAGWAFSIWGPIFLFSGVFTLWLLVRAIQGRHPSFHFQIAPVVCVNFFCNAIWGIIFAQEWFYVALIVMLVLLVTNLVSYRILYAAPDADFGPAYVLVTRLFGGGACAALRDMLRYVAVWLWIGLYTGWISVASLLNAWLAIKFSSYAHDYAAPAAPPLAPTAPVMAPVAPVPAPVFVPHVYSGEAPVGVILMCVAAALAVFVAGLHAGASFAFSVAWGLLATATKTSAYARDTAGSDADAYSVVAVGAGVCSAIAAVALVAAAVASCAVGRGYITPGTGRITACSPAPRDAPRSPSRGDYQSAGPTAL